MLEFHPGLVPDTFRNFQPRPICYLHIDINTATAHRDCMAFFTPQMVDGSVILFDDYAWPQHAECKLAVDEYLETHGLPCVIPLMTGQGLYIHRTNTKRLLPF